MENQHLLLFSRQRKLHIQWQERSWSCHPQLRHWEWLESMWPKLFRLEVPGQLERPWEGPEDLIKVYFSCLQVVLLCSMCVLKIKSTLSYKTRHTRTIIILFVHHNCCKDIFASICNVFSRLFLIQQDGILFHKRRIWIMNETIKIKYIFYLSWAF